MSKVKKAGSTLSQATMKNNIRGEKICGILYRVKW